MNTLRARWRVLAALAAVVLAGHLLLLHGAPHRALPPEPPAQRALITRTIPAAAPVPMAATSPAALPLPPVAEAPKPKPAARALAQPGTAAPSPAAEPPAAAVLLAAASLPSAAPPPAGPAAAFVIPGPVRLHYKVAVFTRGQIWPATGELAWRHDGTGYEAQLVLKAPLVPTRTQQSTGTIGAEGLAPLRFSEKFRNEQAAHFERDKGKVSFSSNQPDAPLQAGAQDRLSVMLQLGAMIAGEPRKYRPGSTISIQTAGTRDAESWLFTVEGEEQLQLPGGTLAALKLIRNPRREFDQRVELWLAPGMAYVPVRLRLTQANGDWVDQQWSSTDRG